MELILANFAGSVRRETLNGKEYLVVPLTMIVRGVLNGSNGALYYPPEEWADASTWNHMPIVLRHPYKHGRPTSARQPSILNKSGIGFVFEAKPSSSGEALVAEGWFDVEATKRIHPGVYSDLEAGRQIELSTGLRAEYEKAPTGAAYNGAAYSYIVRNMQPDHLAVLPDQVGACSLTMGCGVHVTTNTANDAKDGFTIEVVDKIDADFITNLSEGEGFERVLEGDKQRYRTWKKKVVINDNDKTSIWQKLGALLGVTTNAPKMPPDEEMGEMDPDNEDPSVDDPTGSSKKKPKKEPAMAKLTENDRPKLIKELTANCDCWDAKKDAATLKVLPLDKLAQLVNHAEEEAENRDLVESVKGGLTDTAGAKLSFNAETRKWEAEPAETPTPKPKTVVNKGGEEEEPVTSVLSVEDQDTLNWAKKEQAKKRTQIITKLVANVHPDHRAEKVKKLQKRTLNQLEELYDELQEFSANAGPEDDDDDDEDVQPRGGNRKPGRYAGQGRVANSDESHDDITNNLLIPPTLEFGNDVTNLRKRLEASRQN